MSSQSNVDIKVGLISCSGEEISLGTLSRAAVRLVLEKYRPLQTVTICLPLFLAGDGGERAFAERYPTIAVDGCKKGCAWKGTEKYSGKVDDIIFLDELLASMGESAPHSRRDFTERDWALAEKVAQEIAGRVDRVLVKAVEQGRKSEDSSANQCACASATPKTINISVDGKTFEIVAFEAVCALVERSMLVGDKERGMELLRQVRIYNGSLEGASDEALEKVLLDEYRKIIRI